MGGGGACPQTPLAARAFGARDLPRLALKSGYGPARPSAGQRITRSIVLPVSPGFSGTKNLFSSAKLLSNMSCVKYERKLFPLMVKDLFSPL